MALTHETIHAGLLRGIELGAERQFKISCAVIDQHGRTLGVLRHSNAGWATPEIALGKANTAVVYHTPTADLYERWQRERPLFGANVASWGSTRGWYVCEGGVPLHDGDGAILGGIGVAGCFPAINDHEVASLLARWFEDHL